jgi:hypothetical protein
MSRPPERPDEPERTRERRLPVPPPGEPVTDQPTDQLRPPQAPDPTRPMDPAEPLPVVAPRRRGRTPYVIAALVLLVVAIGVAAVLVYG